MRILIAEDDAEMRRIVADTLRDEGYDVVEASNAHELLGRLVQSKTSSDPRREAINLIVTDVRMPGCSGLDLMEILREADWETPMIVMTAFGDDETRARAKGLGAVMLDKPFRLDVLLATIRASLA